MAKTSVSHDPFQSGDFDAILDRSADEVKEPARAPNGPWIVRCTGVFFKKTSKEDLEDNPDLPLGRVSFMHTPDTPLDGVDPEAVAAGEWRGRKIYTERRIKEQGDDARILNLVRMHGVDPENYSSFRKAVEACKGRTVRASVSIYTYDSKATGETVVRDQLSNFAPVGDDD